MINLFTFNKTLILELIILDYKKNLWEIKIRISLSNELVTSSNLNIFKNLLDDFSKKKMFVHNKSYFSYNNFNCSVLFLFILSFFNRVLYLKSISCYWFGFFFTYLIFINWIFIKWIAHRLSSAKTSDYQIYTFTLSNFLCSYMKYVLNYT